MRPQSGGAGGRGPRRTHLGGALEGHREELRIVLALEGDRVLVAGALEDLGHVAEVEPEGHRPVAALRESGAVRCGAVGPPRDG